MNDLHTFLQNAVNDLQVLLTEYQDDEAFIKAVKEKWQDKDDMHRTFVMAYQNKMVRLEDEAGDETGKEKRVNVLNGRIQSM